MTSPEKRDHADLPTSPPAATPPQADSSNALDQAASISTALNGTDDFDALTRNLREALECGKTKVWLKEAERRDFRIILVDKVRFCFPVHHS